MLEGYSKRQKLAATATGLFAVIVFASTWFPDFWSLFSDTPFFQWVFNRWPAMTPAVYLYLKLLVYVTALGLLYAILRAIYQQKKEYGWLEAIADEDDREIENRVRALPWNLDSPDVRPHLHGREPYVELRAILQNNTVYILTYEHLEGKFDLQKSALQYAPQIVNQSFEIKHAQPYKLKLRQYLQPTNAEQITKDGKAVIAGGNVAVCCSYTNRAGETKRTRIPLNDLQFEVTPG